MGAEMNIGYLHKVSVSLNGTDRGKESGNKVGPKRFDFIYGIGSDGLSPLECALEGKKEKDELVLDIRENDAVHIFQHLWIPELEDLFLYGAPNLQVMVLSVGEAEPREVIRALAENARCGESCCNH